MNKQTQGYFYPDPQNQAQRAFTVHRKRELARRIHQLQAFEWFPIVREHVRTTQLSGAAFELDVALFLMNLPLKVERTTETRIKEQDFDLRFYMSDPPLAVEVKAKEDDTEFTLSTIKSTVRTAAKQMPKGRTGFLFIRIPPDWVSSELEENYHDYLAAAARDTSRISAIFTAVDKFSRVPDGGGRVQRVWDYFRTDNCPDDEWDFALKLRTLNEGDFTFMAPTDPF